ncbi:MAG TPA: cyclic nucleotide-binding domain-containing protein [Planctomycetaceae bacterium]|nr:cyclic nucleotide-binding domain-containing protein [Planctomycetaceae bacterium]
MPTGSTSSHRFLESLPERQRVQLEAIATRRHWPPGALLFQEGHEHENIYLLLCGHVRLDMLVPDRGRTALLTVGPGDLVGWSPLTGAQTMTATAMALEPTQALAFNGTRLRDACTEDHELGYYVMRQIVITLSERLLSTRLQLLDLFRGHEPRASSAPDLC